MRVGSGSRFGFRVVPWLALSGLALVAAPASAVTIEWVFVGDPDNAADPSGVCYAANCGSVPYEYEISKFEVTNAQYAELLNAKAAEDPLGLYHPEMDGDPQGGITRSGTSGSYTYAVKLGFADKPVNFVSLFDALRFTNWLGNGQGGGDTEDGSYTLLGGTPTPSNAATVTSNEATIFLPSENEWVKAAYYDPVTASYFDFPAGSDTATSCAAPTGTANTANCNATAGGVTDVGAYPGSASPNGTFDQGGNVFEWTEQIVSETHRAIRGGSWDLSVDFLSASIPFNSNSAGSTRSTGFRVVRFIPEPERILLSVMVLATLAAVRQPAAGTL
jgi:formylglycine-generating enzyme required for sulfatase activity